MSDPTRPVLMAHPVAVDAYARFRINRWERARARAVACVQIVLMALALFAFYVAIVVLGPVVGS